VGEVLNLVCLEPKCIKNSIICGICFDEEHRSHKVKPVKVIINSSKKYLQHLTPTNFDVDKIRQSVIDTRNKLLNSFDDFEKYVKNSIDSIRSNILAVFLKVSDQIELKTGKND
jgi:esterase/lipase